MQRTIPHGDDGFTPQRFELSDLSILDADTPLTDDYHRESMDDHAFKDVEINSLKVVGKSFATVTVGKNEKRSLIPKPYPACNVGKKNWYIGPGDEAMESVQPVKVGMGPATVLYRGC